MADLVEEITESTSIGESVVHFISSINFTDTVLTLSEIYDITLTTGDVLRFTTLDVDTTWMGEAYQAIPIKRGTISLHSDLEIDKLDISFGLIGIIIGTEQYTIAQAVEKGFFRNATVKVRIIDFTSEIDAQRTIFDGFVSDGVSYNLGAITLKCGSILDRLNESFPKLIYSEFCPHVLFGEGCGVASAPWTFANSATASSTTVNIYSPIFSYAVHEENYWINGSLLFTTGDNSGVARTIIEHHEGYVVVLVPFTEPVLDTDAFSVVAGCNKTGTTCDEKFDNYVNFLGFEYIPNAQDLYNVQ